MTDQPLNSKPDNSAAGDDTRPASEQDQSSQPKGGGESSADDLSSDAEPSAAELAEVDALIKEQDPNFERSLKDVEQLKNESVDLGEEIVEITDDLLNEKSSAEETPAIAIERSAFLFRCRQAFSRQLRRILYALQYYARNILPLTKEAIIWFIKLNLLLLKNTISGISITSRYFRGLSAQEKLIALAIPLLCALIFLVLRFTLANRVLTVRTDTYLNSLGQVADHTYFVKPGERNLDFYGDFSPLKFYVLIKKVVVNLRPSEHSSANPMGAFQFFLQASSEDGAIEIKERSVAFRDAIQQTLAGVPYDELITPAGKDAVKDLLRQRLNALMKHGKIRHVLYDHIVLKP